MRTLSPNPSWARLRLLVAALLATGLLAACGGGNATPAGAPDAGKLNPAIEKVMAQASIPGAIVGVWRPGVAPYVHAFGVRDTSTKQPMETNFYTRIGSVTKTFTVTAVLQLVDQGKVGLDDSIGKYIAGVPDGNVVTIQELAEMRSGLPSYTANEAWVKLLVANPTRSWTPEQVLTYAFSQPLLFTPGTDFNYSNTNTVLLGLVVEKESGLSLPTYIQRHILDPEHLTHTAFPNDATFPNPHAQGYTQQSADGETANATDWDPSWGWAAGAMTSDLTDMHAWAEVLATGGLLSKKTQAEREKFIGDPNGSAYGLGMFRIGGWVGHNGSPPGYQTLVVYLPAMRATMVIFVNSDIPYQGSALSTLVGQAITKIISPDHIYTTGNASSQAPPES